MTKAKLNTIELFRGIAAIMVVFYHISIHYDANFSTLPFFGVAKFGHAGVDFFFTLSGFIIFYVHNKDIGHKSMLYPYFIKRFVRVFPFYWVALITTLLMIPFVSSAVSPTFLELLKEAILWPKGGDGLVLGVGWTLQNEIIFYILFSFLIFNKLIGTILLSAWFGAVIINSYLLPSPYSLPALLSEYNIQFLMGILSAYIVLKAKIKSPLIWLLFGGASFITTATLEVIGDINGKALLAHFLYGISSALLIIGAVLCEQKYNVRIHSFGRSIGSSSYSIYLTHGIFIGVFYKALSIIGFVDNVPLVISATLIVILTIASAINISKYVEIPLTKKIRSAMFSK